MADFTSSLYLGFEHATRQLAEWERLTTGKPAALMSPPGAAEIESKLAGLTGCERVLLGPSTLHLFWDLFGMLGAWDVNLFLDAGAYPIARWGVERAAARGRPVRVFSRHDARALKAAVAASGGRPPVVVADGFCPGCGTPAPLREYLECVERRGGLVVLDDTQALGIFGRSPGVWAPYGSGGGGSLRLAGIGCWAPVVLVSSLAKAFGAPLAMLGGGARLVGQFERDSATRVHCSPPSAPAIGAAAHALDVNRRWGDRRRWRLAERVSRLRRGSARFGLSDSRGLFPVQPLRLPAGVAAANVYRRLLDRGVRTVLHRGSEGEAHISLVVTARHRFSEIDYAVECLAEAVADRPLVAWKGAKGNGEPIAAFGKWDAARIGKSGRGGVW